MSSLPISSSDPHVPIYVSIEHEDLLRSPVGRGAVQAYSEGFDLTDHTTQLNSTTNLSVEVIALDDTCVVDQVHKIMRHGTCYPSPGSYSSIKSFADAVTEYLSWANMSDSMADELQFLKTWNLTELLLNLTIEVDNITALGVQEAFDVGSSFRSKYAYLYTSKETVWTNAKERVVRTAQDFLCGFHDEDWDSDLLVKVSNTDETLGGNTLTTALRQGIFEYIMALVAAPS